MAAKGHVGMKETKAGMKGTVREGSTYLKAELVSRLFGGSTGLALIGFSSEDEVVFYDSGAERTYGYTPEEVEATLRRCDLIADDVWKRLVDPLHQGVTVSATEFTTRRKDGRLIALRATAIADNDPTDVAYLLLLKDCSEIEAALANAREMRDTFTQNMQHSEREAEFLRELLRHTMETIRLAVLVTDVPSGLVAYVNETFESLTGVNRMSAMGRRLADVFAQFPETGTALHAFVDQVREAGFSSIPRHEELEFQTGKRTIHMYGRPISVEGHPNQYTLLILEDHTQRQRLQAQLMQSEKLAAVGQLAAGVAHEIRNPLNTIYNALYDLQEILRDPTPEIREDIDIATEEIRRTQDIINNLLDFARESEHSLGRSRANLTLKKTIRLVQHDLVNRQIRVRLDLRPLPEVSISSSALKQVLINLIMNAVHAMSNGGTLTLRSRRCEGKIPNPTPPSIFSSPEATVEVAPIEGIQAGDGDGVTLENYREHVVLEIEDTGSGIAREHLPYIFNPFFTTKPPGSGTGLGLSVVYSLVRDAGGAISVRSKAGSGTTFTIELPGLPGNDPNEST